MAEETTNTTISKTNTGFPDYLDFDKLRTEGIDYLGRLTGKIWTDYNVHDPGITILEMLCYALLDLGYRTNLPAVDIFTRNPEDTAADNNFFTPAQILTCNPLTIIDFRKLLIDIGGVKNAWLEVATDEKDFCSQRPEPVPQPDPAFVATHVPAREEPACIDFLNGLYHVYIDLEIDIEKEFENDVAARQSFLKDITTKVKEALMAHRNLCEDFIDVYILCKQETGVCADIELEENANAEQVYLAVVEKLKDFFSPSPQFYTLQQLLDKQKPIDEIFAGRPYNITESHGFVDTEELAQLTLRKEIHLSDVYHAIFDVEGVKGVSRLRMQTCQGGVVNQIKGWKYHIPENHVPEFSLNCSGFQFNRHGATVYVDTQKFEGLFTINFSHNGKIQYQVPSPYLDVEIPQGVYRSDIDDYYSIQNEFPRVYGIAAGGLSENASSQRKAQAYQLKAWLLFFDQLLANYLAQLKNIRSLFAMSSSNDKDRHTYFIQQLTTVPDHQKLVRFNLTENDDNALGTEGSILVRPVDKKDLITLMEQDKLHTLSLDDLNPYTFNTLTEQDTVISQLKNDLYFEQIQCEFVTKNNDCIFYYIFTSSDELALISRKYFKAMEEAKEHAASVKYIGTFDENYRSFITPEHTFSFNIELNLRSFSKYLQLIVEDKALFYRRRQEFLNHLLSRFAEQFTDYALLAFGFEDSHQLQLSEIKHKESYLSHYAELSSNRGKAYDYLENNWNNDNTSGFEKKVKVLAGMDNLKRQSLCNFVVARYDEQYAVSLKMAGTTYFAVEGAFDSREEGLQVAQSLFLAMKERTNYRTKYIDYDQVYQLEIHFDDHLKATFPVTYKTESEALKTAGRLSNLFVKADPVKSVFVSSYIYIPELMDASGKVIRRSVATYTSEEDATAGALKAIKKIDDLKQWEYEESSPALGKLYPISFIKDKLSFINTDAFKIDVNNTIIDKPDLFTYEVLDKGNTFKFTSAHEFSTAAQAKNNAYDLLALLTDESSYRIFQDTDSNKFLLRIENDEGIQAVSSMESDTEEKAKKEQNDILNIVKKHQYEIRIEQEPNQWKFNYKLGYEQSNLHTFESVKDYKNEEEAIQAATLFIDADSTLRLTQNKNQLTLTVEPEDAEPIAVARVNASGNESEEKAKDAVAKLLAEKKERDKLIEDPKPDDFESSVSLDEISKQGLFVYRLIDKDHVPAFYTKTFTDKKQATDERKQLEKLFHHPPDYLQLCMGGEHLIHKRKDNKTNAYWYHYRLRSLDHFYSAGDMAGQSLVLFESTKAYQSITEAEDAFKENYLYLIHLASDVSNYGKKISLTEILVQQTDPCIKSDSLVFVPQATLDELGPGTDEAVKKLAGLAMSYPIRLVSRTSPEFENLFPCEKILPTDAKACGKEQENYVYYFILQSQTDDKWQSTGYYDTPEEAWKEFYFFLILLHYPGNYYVDCDPCTKEENNTYHVYIHEVLAESTERFDNEEQAWSKEGVQKFICVTQSEESFHTYLRKSDCCYAFYVACRDSLVYHPCKYDTVQKRDQALLSLYQRLKESIKNRSWQIDDSENNLLLLNASGESFAGMPRHSDNECNSDQIAYLSVFAEQEKYYQINEDGNIILKSDNNEILAWSVKENSTIAEWKTLLQTFLCHYPIIKTKGEKNREESKYCIEIKLPGFNTCKEDIGEWTPCGCGQGKEANDFDCYVAWKSRCCYTTCWEAEQALQTILRLLQRYDFYQPVFDCECHSYGITLQFEKYAITTNPNVTYYREENNLQEWNNSEIVAINPQCYPCKEDACEAVERAKKLINREGLFMVEHILLRPRCQEDCSCREYLRYCENETDCDFIWKVPDEDPCSEERDICFVPGADPYSFIATVVLPAWPERFRKKENRTLLENIIYREAPAHVLLRILWLAPHDLCCFESKYKSWNRWLAQKKTCKDDFSVCDFLEFLFNRNYECLDDCQVCEPCRDEDDQSQPCFAEDEDKGDQNDYLNQINQLYCWIDQQCEEYRYRDCESRDQPPPDNDNPNSPAIFLAEPKNVQQPESDEATTTSVRRKPQAVNARLMKYKKGIEAVAEEAKNNPVISKAQRFLSDPKPTYDRLSKLATEILQNKKQKTKGVKPLTKVQKLNLLQNTICYWLDRNCFNGKGKEELDKLKTITKKLIKEKINPIRIYDHWNFVEIKNYEPGLNENNLKALFIHEKK